MNPLDGDFECQQWFSVIAGRLKMNANSEGTRVEVNNVLAAYSSSRIARSLTAKALKAINTIFNLICHEAFSQEEASLRTRIDDLITAVATSSLCSSMIIRVMERVTIRYQGEALNFLREVIQRKWITLKLSRDSFRFNEVELDIELNINRNKFSFRSRLSFLISFRHDVKRFTSPRAVDVHSSF